jgi:tRNA (cmo5U34)-methyltransferase
MTTRKKNFSFAEHAPSFGKHISASIRGYGDTLLPTCTSLSLRFLQPGTRVIDAGCSTGHPLASIRRANRAIRPDVQYIGIDVEPGFGVHWDRLKAKNLRFDVADARAYDFSNSSLILSVFTVQFVRPADKLPLLKRFYDGLVEGGALFIAEKTLADTARMQDAVTFPYYDYKLKQGFTPEEILTKERNLRGQMTLWTEAELKSALSQTGFRHIETIWKDLVFMGVVALK